MKYYVDVMERNRSARTEIVRTFLFNSRGEMNGMLNRLYRAKEYERVVVKDVSKTLVDYGHAIIVFGKLKRGSEL